MCVCLFIIPISFFFSFVHFFFFDNILVAKKKKKVEHGIKSVFPTRVLSFFFFFSLLHRRIPGFRFFLPH